MATLNMKSKVAIPEIEAEVETPKLNRDKNYGEVGGMQGVKYVQGNAYFRANGDFHSWTEPDQALKPETPEGELLRKRKEARDDKKWGRIPQRAGAPELPKKVMDASRENAQALAAEAQAV
jgi:hypothetical protein